VVSFGLILFIKFIHMKNIFLYFLLIIGLSTNSCSQTKKEMKAAPTYKPSASEKTAIFASGCFWCVEAVFESVEGVNEVVSGYCGGTEKDSNYERVSGGWTNHAEAVTVYYDPAKINYNTLLEVFFGSHDPSTLNRQGPDAGRQYRSAIFYNDDIEKAAAESYIEKLYADGIYRRGAITTEVSKSTGFFPAEAYHQDYEKNNPDNSYVLAVSVPRLKKFLAKYPQLLKKNAGGH
jgi:peptide-methionine (S)-S-oxide reductase